MINFEQRCLSKKTPEKNPLEILLADSDLSIRTYQALKNSNIMNLSDLVGYVESGLAKNNTGLNQKSWQEIAVLLKKHDLVTKTDSTND